MDLEVFGLDTNSLHSEFEVSQLAKQRVKIAFFNLFEVVPRRYKYLLEILNLIF